MQLSQPISYNKQVSRELNMYLEMIGYVFHEFADVNWSRKCLSEIGFYYKNKKLKTEYFFGIWFDLWEHYGMPLSIVFDYYGKAPIQWHTSLQNFIKSNYKEGIQLKDFNGFTCITFEYSFFKFDGGDDIESLAEILDSTINYGEKIATP